MTVFLLLFNFPFGNFFAFFKLLVSIPIGKNVVFMMIIENVKQLGELIKANRKEMGFTQADLASFCKVGKSFYR